ncbi:unnamed protein product [Sphagnum jensenii]|uniref:Uncharacterized protein n=1 Tax=Sphagnum jensenii TaxID=128206 RepID=A0ABP1B3K8_9BRYO
MAHVISLVELFGSQGLLLQSRCMEWRQQAVMWRMETAVQPARMLAMTVACSLGSMDVVFVNNISSSSSSINACGAAAAPAVQDATAPPPVRRDCYKRAPRTVALKVRRVRKRSASGGGGGGSDEEDAKGGEGFSEGSGCDDGSSGGGSWGGGENGRGGWDNWGESWNEHEGRRRWGEQLGSHAAVGLLYQAACWISFSRCMYFAFHKLLGFGSLTGSKGASESTSLAQISSGFLHKKPLHLHLPAAAATKCVC